MNRLANRRAKEESATVELISDVVVVVVVVVANCTTVFQSLLLLLHCCHSHQALVQSTTFLSCPFLRFSSLSLPLFLVAQLSSASQLLDFLELDSSTLMARSV